MANVVSHNANLPPKILIWEKHGANTPVVYSYDCPVDSHKVVSSVNLKTNATCPRHHKILTGEKVVDIT